MCDPQSHANNQPTGDPWLGADREVGLDIEVGGAYELMEFSLKRIFDVRVPGRCLGRLGPQVHNS